MGSTSWGKPLRRSKIRAWAGRKWYGAKRRVLWIRWRSLFAQRKGETLPVLWFRHRTPLLRSLKGVDMKYQHSKVVNLRLAAAALDGLILHPGEIFSYWRILGKPSRRRGYVEGMVLHQGRVELGVGGGLCQLSNLIYWSALHTPLSILERHRHGYDVFPDADRTQPFGSGATCFYPHIDLMIRNNTDSPFQLRVRVDGDFLEGSWRASMPKDRTYDIQEQDPQIRAEYWGGYTRCNRLVRFTRDLSGSLLSEELVAQNEAVMMYAPFLEDVTKPASRGINEYEIE